MLQAKEGSLISVCKKVKLCGGCFKESSANRLFVECFQEKHSYFGNDSRKISFSGECFQESRLLS